MMTRDSIHVSSRPFWTNPDFYAPLILVAAGLVFFADALFSSKNFFYRDILNFHYPLRRVLIDSFARGELPLWNPYVYLGQPMLANPNYMTFYPTNLLHLLFPFNYAFKLHFILHPIAGGLGIYFLARRLGIRGEAALGGALAYELSGTALSFLNLYNIVPAVALMPWIAWAFYGALREHTCRRTIAFGVLLALQLIALEPLIFQCDVLLLAALAVIWVWEQGDRFGALHRIGGVSAAGALLAIGLAAVQILPTLELLPLSARGSGLGLNIAGEWSVHPVDLLNTIIPNLFGNPFTIDVSDYWGELYHESTAGYLASFFCGSVTILLSALAFFSRRTKFRTTMVVLFGISILLGLGKFTPVYPWLYNHVPLFNLGRYPSKYFLLSSLIVSILASLGLEAVMNAKTDERPGSRMDRACMIGAVLGACLIGLALYWKIDRGPLESMIRAKTLPALAGTKNIPAIAAGLSNSIRTAGVFLFLSSLLVAARRWMKRSAALVGILVLFIPLELIPANLGLAPLISDADMDFIPDVDLYMRQQGPRELWRAVSPNLMTPQPEGFSLRAPNRSSAWMVLFYRRSGRSLDGIRDGIQYSIDRSIDHLNTRESNLLWQGCLDLPPKERLDLLANLNSSMVMSLGQPQNPRAELLLRFDTHSSLDYGLYRLKNALPRAYFATHVIEVASADEARSRLLETRAGLQDSVILESVKPLRPAPSRGGQVKIVGYESNRVLCQVQSHSPGYLVLLDSYYPGWNATVDGRQTDILRANYAFRAVFVPAGSHRVEFRFAPRTFYAGVAITLATALMAVLLCL
jgi:hypothetical protein